MVRTMSDVPLTEYDYLIECLDLLTPDSEWQQYSILAHHFRIPSNVSNDQVLRHMISLQKLPKGTLKTREGNDLNAINDLRPNDMFTLFGIRCKIVKHYRYPNRVPHMSGFFEYTHIGEESILRNLDYERAWSLYTDGVLTIP
jgi:hypothetical protein